METERRRFSKVILETNVTHNITRSSDSFSTVPTIVNRGDWGCIVRDLETIIVLVLLAFNSNELLIIKFCRFGDKNQVKSSDFNATILTFSGFPQSHFLGFLTVSSEPLFRYYVGYKPYQSIHVPVYPCLIISEGRRNCSPF